MPQQNANAEKTSDDGPAIAVNFLVELFGEELLELGLLLLWLLVTTFWKQLLIAAGGALVITGIIAGFADFSGGNRPRSLFSYGNDKESKTQMDVGLKNP